LPFASRSSSRRARLLAALALAAAGLLLVLAPGDVLASAAGIFLVVPAIVLLLLDVLRTERRRHELAEEELAREAATLESLVSSFGTIAATLDPHEIPELARREAERLFGARAELLPAGADSEPLDGEVLVPLRLREETVGLLRLVPERPLGRADAARALVLADFAERVHENARLRVEAESRESERDRLSDQLVTAEQEERRRLALYLHDTSLQSLSGIALMLDAAHHSLTHERLDEAGTIVESARRRLREAIRGLRDLSFALEPVILRDQGFGPAVTALAERTALGTPIAFEIDVDAADGLADKAQAALYQIIREALHGAVLRGPPTQVSLVVHETEGGGFEAVIADDAPGERRRASFEPIVERARAVSARVEVEQGDAAGTTVRVRFPTYAARG
jgi:signal transduction histidine kinase